MNILEIKIKQATGGEKRNVGRLLKFGMQWRRKWRNFEIIV
jgi:hypothetical protein